VDGWLKAQLHLGKLYFAAYKPDCKALSAYFDKFLQILRNGANDFACV
jgi:hypothetical protein